MPEMKAPDNKRNVPGKLSAWRNARRRESHRAILVAAYQEFSARGFQSVSVIDIAKAAPVSTATIYKHFTSKEMLVAAVVEEFFEPEPCVPFNAKQDRNEQAYAFLSSMVLADARILMGDLVKQDYEGPALAAFDGWLIASAKRLDI